MATSLFISPKQRPRVNAPTSVRQLQIYGTFSGKEGGSDGKEGGSDGREDMDITTYTFNSTETSVLFPDGLIDAA